MDTMYEVEFKGKRRVYLPGSELRLNELMSIHFRDQSCIGYTLESHARVECHECIDMDDGEDCYHSCVSHSTRLHLRFETKTTSWISTSAEITMEDDEEVVLYPHLEYFTQPRASHSGREFKSNKEDSMKTYGSPLVTEVLVLDELNQGIRIKKIDHPWSKIRLLFLAVNDPHCAQTFGRLPNELLVRLVDLIRPHYTRENFSYDYLS
jgi:hypothetical protein